MHKIYAPKLNNNDDTCLLREWLCEDAQEITEQDAIALLETSKATHDLYSEYPGIFQHLAEVGTECEVGQVIAYIFANEEERQHFLCEENKSQTLTPASSLIITEGAQKLIEEHGLSAARLQLLGKKIIKQSDIAQLIEQAVTKESLPLSRQQIAVGKTVSRSHQLIPDAFVVMKVWCDEVLLYLQHYNEQQESMVGLPEVLIKLLAGLHQKFPLFFGSLENDQSFVPAREGPHVGITIDVGKGLFIPVVRDAGAKSLQETADCLMDFRVQALRNTFREDELSGGHITLSLNTEQDVVFAIPIILPSQSCMLSLGSVQKELQLHKEQGIVQHSFVYIGLACDHRVINGREAVEFLKTIKRIVEAPQEVIR